MKFKKADTVKVLSGKDKGKVGKIEKIFSAKMSAMVEGVNQFKRHVKGRSQSGAAQTSGQKSEIITITKPLSISKLGLVCPNCKKITRVGFKMEKGSKVRICRKCKKTIN